MIDLGFGFSPSNTNTCRKRDLGFAGLNDLALLCEYHIDAGMFTTFNGSTPVTAGGQRVNRWEDQSGNGNHLLKANDLGHEYQTNDGGRIRCNDSTIWDGINLAPSLDKNSEFTIMGIMSTTSLVNYARFGGLRNGINAGVTAISWNGKLALNLFDPRGTNEIIVHGDTSIPLTGSDYVHYIMSYNGAGNAAGVVGIYFNGEPEELTTQSDGLGEGFDITDPARVLEVRAWLYIKHFAMASEAINDAQAAILFAEAQDRYGLWS